MIAFLFATMIVAGGGAEIAPMPRAVPERYPIEVSVLRGDPLGSMKSGTILSVTEVEIHTTSGIAANLQVGDSFSIKAGEGESTIETRGIILEITPTKKKDGSIAVNLKAKTTSRGLDLDIPEARITRLVKPGETIRLRLVADSPTNQTWLEVKVHAAK